MASRSRSRAASQRSRACDWHFGQCRLRQVMERSPLPALWGVFSNGEFGPGIETGLAFSTPTVPEATHHKLGAFATLMRPSMANAQQGEPMLETYFSAPKTLWRLRGGISGPHIDAFADDLEHDGYAASQCHSVPSCRLPSWLLRPAERWCPEGYRSHPAGILPSSSSPLPIALISGAERSAITHSLE